MSNNQANITAVSNANRDRMGSNTVNSPINRLINNTSTANDVKQISYKTHQKFSDYYPIISNASPIASTNNNSKPVNNCNNNTSNGIPVIKNTLLTLTDTTRINSGASTNSSKTITTGNTATANSQSNKFTVKSHLRDTQWIKENIMRNLQTRKPLAAASILNTLTSPFSQDSSGYNGARGGNNTGTSNSYLVTPITINGSFQTHTSEESTRSTASTINDIKLNSTLQHSLSYRQPAKNPRSQEIVKKVEFVNINDNLSTNNANNANMNSFQRLCEIASRWNSKNRLLASQVVTLKETNSKKKFNSTSLSNLNDNQSNSNANKNKFLKKRTSNSDEHKGEANSVTSTMKTDTTGNTRKRYSKLIAKNFIQLRPVNEIDTFTNIHYAFSTEAKTPSMPQLATVPTVNSINTLSTTTTTANTKNDNSVSTNNSIKWINTKNIMGIQQPLRVS